MESEKAILIAIFGRTQNNVTMLRILLPSLLWLIGSPPEGAPGAQSFNLSDSADVSTSDVFQPSIHTSHDCDVEVLPSPTYPTNSGGTDLEADCTNSIFINPDGTITALSIHCTNQAFERSVERFFAQMRWQTHDIAGRPCPQLGTTINYPIQFRLSE